MIEDEYGNRIVAICPNCKGEVIAYRDASGAIFGGQCVGCLAFVDTENSREYRERLALARGLPASATWEQIREARG
jgi:alkyl hydroperoxide reductase subunit AhpF